MKKKTDREHDLARKLRIEEKKSFREIEKLTGISKTQICKWAKEEGWPEPQQERKRQRLTVSGSLYGSCRYDRYR